MLGPSLHRRNKSEYTPWAGYFLANSEKIVTKSIFREMNTIFFGNNLSPLNIYNVPTQMHYIKPGPEVINFMLNSAEHKIYPAHKC